MELTSGPFPTEEEFNLPGIHSPPLLTLLSTSLIKATVHPRTLLLIPLYHLLHHLTVHLLLLPSLHPTTHPPYHHPTTHPLSLHPTTHPPSLLHTTPPLSHPHPMTVPPHNPQETPDHPKFLFYLPQEKMVSAQPESGSPRLVLESLPLALPVLEYFHKLTTALILMRAILLIYTKSMYNVPKI